MNVNTDTTDGVKLASGLYYTVLEYVNGPGGGKPLVCMLQPRLFLPGAQNANPYFIKLDNDNVKTTTKL